MLRTQVLPNGLGELEKLKTIKLKSVRLEALPSTLKGLSALETLIIRGCPKLKSLPGDVTELQALKTLELMNLDQLAGSCVCEI